MTDSLHIVCPHCDAVNRVPADKLRSQPTCGKCKRTLFNAHPVELNGNNFAQHISRNDIPDMMKAMAFRSPKQLEAARDKAVAGGWLQYNRPAKRLIGSYFSR